MRMDHHVDFPIIPFDDSNLGMESEETELEGLREKERLKTWRVKDASFGREEMSDVWKLEEQNSFLAPMNHQGRWRREGDGCLFLSLSFLLLFFPDASTMEEMTTSPNKKSGNKLHWIRMLGWMDDSKSGLIRCG